MYNQAETLLIVDLETKINQLQLLIGCIWFIKPLLYSCVNVFVGMIPAPILFGFLIDQACVSWQQATCEGEKGACLVYDNWAMGTYLLFLVFTCKGLSFAFFILATCLYRSPHTHPTINVVTVPNSMTRSTVISSELQPIAGADKHDMCESDKT